MSLEDDDPTWAKAHQASYETEPLVEMQGSTKVPVGFVLNLYATLPMDKPPGEERREVGAALWARLRRILDSTLVEEAGKAQVEVEPMRIAAVLRPENEMKPEIALKARVVHEETFQAVTPDERQRMSAFEKRLAARGLRSGHW